MAGKAYVFYHPQYGGLRVVNNEEGLFFCIEDLVAITDIGRDKLFSISRHGGESGKNVCGNGNKKGSEGF